VERKKLIDILGGVKAYTLHRSRRKNFNRNKVIVRGIDDTWQVDLVDMKKLSRYNNGTKYILVCIDVFSKYGWAVPLKDKFGNSCVDAIKKIFASGRKPKHIQADQGNEFFNRNVKKFLNDKNCNLYAVKSELKACVVERFNRTLKEKMFRYFTNNNTYKYINVLPKILKAYNNTYHRTIEMTPSEVSKENEEEIWNRVYFNDEIINFKFKIGDKVRISLDKNIFEKGYTPNWSEEIFIVHKTIPRVPAVYQIKDLRNEIIEGNFYEEQLQKVFHDDDEEYRIDHIIKTKVEKGIKYALVRWLGYSKEFDSWVKYSDLKNIVKK